MKKHAGSIFFTILFHCCFSQNNRFAIDYGIFPNAYVDVTPSGYVLAGSFNAGAHFLRTDLSGNPLAFTAKSYAGSGIGDFQDIKKLTDKGYLMLAGNALIRTDSNGFAIWSRQYFVPGLGGALYSICPSINGGFYLLGYSNDSVPSRLVIVRTDTGGAILWSKAVKAVAPSANFNPQVVARQYANGDLIVGAQGPIISGFAPYQFTLFRTDSSATTIKWSKSFRGSCPWRDAMILKGYDLVATGFGFTVSWMQVADYAYRVDSAGNVKAVKYFSENVNGNFTTVSAIAGNNFIAGGLSYNFSPFNSGTDAVLLKLDSALNIKWVKRHGITATCCYEQFNCVRQTADGGYIGNGVYFTKTDTAGFSGCMDSSVTYSAVSFPTDTAVMLGIVPVAATDSLKPVIMNDDSLSKNVICYVGIPEKERTVSLKLYPNPTSGTFAISGFADTNIHFPVLMEIYNTFGQKVRSIRMDRAECSVKLPPGIYCWRLIAGHEAATGKLVIE